MRLTNLQSQYLVVDAVKVDVGVGAVGVGAVGVGAVGVGAVGVEGCSPRNVPLQLPSQLLLLSLHHVGPQLSPPFQVQQPSLELGLGATIGAEIGAGTGAATGDGIGTGISVGLGLSVGLPGLIVISAQLKNYGNVSH